MHDWAVGLERLGRAGNGLPAPKTTATPDGDGWRINGRKVFVTLSPIADVCALNLRIPGSKGEDEDGQAAEGDRMGFVFLPATTKGFELQDDWDALGMRGSGSQSPVLNDCPAPPGSVQIAGSTSFSPTSKAKRPAWKQRTR